MGVKVSSVNLGKLVRLGKHNNKCFRAMDNQ